MENKDWHVCGLVIQARPERVSDVISALEAMPGTEVPTSSQEEGKIVVVMGAAESNELLEQIESTRNLEGVLAVSLVYHQQDEQGEEMP